MTKTMRHVIAAFVIAMASIAIYPMICRLAYLERGYTAYGGENVLLLFGFLAAFTIGRGGWEREQHEKSDDSSEDMPPVSPNIQKEMRRCQ